MAFSLNDQFTFHATIGQGGYGKVKFASCKFTKKTFAIKIFKKNQAKSTYTTFLNEVRYMKLLNHSNIPAFYASYDSVDYIKENGEIQEVSAIVMEYMPNGDLWDYIMVSGGFSEEIARAFFRNLIETVEDLHKQGIAHRDIKPRNLFFDGDFNLKIADFGLAIEFKDEEGVIPLDERCGTKGYMAPEIHRNKFSDEGYDGSLVDIFSCGVTLFAMVCGFQPFKVADPRTDDNYLCFARKTFDTVWEDYEKVIKKYFKRSGLSDEFKDLVNGMFAYQPEDRLTIEQIKAHSWYKGDVMDAEELVGFLEELKDEVDEERFQC